MKINNYVLIVSSVSLLVLGIFAVAPFVLAVNNCWDYKTQTDCDTNSTCLWQNNDWGSGWCEKKECWSFRTQKGCVDGNASGMSCRWKTYTPASYCSETYCWSFSGTNQSHCEDTTNDYRLDCIWGPTDTTQKYTYNCQGSWQCYSVNVSNNEAKCKNTTGCTWGSCYERGCWNYATSATCNADVDCHWTIYNYCAKNGCWDQKHKTKTTCENATDSLNCRWNSIWSYCEQLNCWSYNSNQTGCQNAGDVGLQCNWNDPYCETKQCWQNKNNASCSGKIGYDGRNCTWFTPTQVYSWCEKVGCWNVANDNKDNESVTTSQCVNNSWGLSCVWENNTWGSSCYENLTANVFTCGNVTDQKKCFDSMWCWWNPDAKTCNEPSNDTEGGAVTGDFIAPGCWVFDLNITSCLNTTGCGYDSGNKTCIINTSLGGATNIENKGLNCTLLNNSALCDGVAFLPRCCAWQGSSCTENKYSTSCKDSLKTPPEGAAHCTDYNAYSSESTCNQIANHPWYMPCKWNNATKHCEFRSGILFSKGEEGDLDLIDNRDICEKGAGGRWITESYCGKGNMSNNSVTTGRCAPRSGAGGNCDTSCFSCEFKPDGANYTSESAVREACDNSDLGFCVWRSDTKAPNGYGYCEPSSDIKEGGAKCDSNNCDACNSYNEVNAKTKCQEAKCEWKVDPLDATKGSCVSSGTTTCLEKCENCHEQKSCVEKGRGVNGSCTWDVNVGLCKKSTTSNNTGAGELCFDGIDNDGDGKIDCDDGSCYTESFCGGTFIKDCKQYSTNDTCIPNGCSWLNDTYGFWCDQPSAVCWQYDGDQAGCAVKSDCEWHATSSSLCNMNDSVWGECSVLNRSNCNTNSRCYWFVDPHMSAIGGSTGWCGHRHDLCHFNETLRSNQTACNIANETFGGNLTCSWGFDPWSPNGGYCESGCFSLGSSCSTNGMCKSHDGWCDPKGFGGNGTQTFGCFQYEIQSVCTNQTNCKWFSDSNPRCDVSYRTDCFNFKANAACNANINCTWIGASVGGWCDQKDNLCRWNTTQAKCETDPNCFWKDWSGGYSSCEPIVINATGEVNCTSLNGTWRGGWCESSTIATMFSGMEMESQPAPLGNDPCGEANISAFSDICYFGMKDSKDNFGLGTVVKNIRDAAMCNGISTWQGVGAGNNTAKYYWYIDSDGKTSGGCSLYSNSSSVGWDLHFRYEASFVNGSVKETKKSERCVDGSWKPSDIKLSAWRQKMCNEIQGGMISVNKDDMESISGLLNLSSTIRFYASTANATTNESSPADTVGPSYFTSGTIDFTSECCWGISDQSLDCDGDGLSAANDPECSSLMNKGYIPFEDCFANNIDDDADGLTDCNDYDCKGSTYCVENKLGVESSTYVDNIAPKIIYWNIEKYPDAALLSFDTNEPANGSIDFYRNSSSCIILNKTLYDVGIYNNNTQKYKNWHEVEIYNDTGVSSLNYSLNGNRTYFYKLKVCDKSGNCAQSACSNFTTVASQAACKKCKFIFDMDLPAGWLLDLDLDTNGTYETELHRQCGSSAGILINYTTARSVNLRVRDNSTNTTLFLLDARLTRSLAHNQKMRDIQDSKGVKKGTTSTTAGTTVGYAGLSKEVSNKLVDKLHPKSCMIQIDKGTGSCDLLYHCDDDLKNCVRRDTQSGVLLNESGSNYCIWKLPCIFSTYAGGAPGSSSSGSSGSSSSSGGGGGGGGGGGAAATPSNVASSAAKLWSSVAPSVPAVFAINKPDFGITHVTFGVKNIAANVEIKVANLKSNPVTTAPASKVYQYIEISKTNIDNLNIENAKIKFRIDKAWLSSNNVDKYNIALYKYTTQWALLTTNVVGDDISNVFYEAATDGFSNFAIGIKAEAPAEPQVTAEAAAALPAEEMQEEKPGEISSSAVQEERIEFQQQKKRKGIIPTIIVFAVFALLVYILYFQRKKRRL